MGQRVLLVRHGPQPTEDRIATWLRSVGFVVDNRQPFAGEPLGSVQGDIAGTVIYGGMQNVYETQRHPSLKEEYRWIEACLKSDIPMLGICQGAQQIAYHLGAWVGPRPEPVHEFGLTEIEPTKEAGDFLTRPQWVTQAHFHTFDLPEGAVHLARNDLYENQAFRIGDRVYGTQYHPECTPEILTRWTKDKDAFYADHPDRSAEKDIAFAQSQDAAQSRWLHGFLEKLFGEPA